VNIARAATLRTPLLAALLLGTVGVTLRLTVSGTERLAAWWESERPLIYAVWHGRMLMLPWLNARLVRRARARPTCVLASRSHDGELVARFARHFGLPVVRGSSSRGGAAAARALVRVVRAGADVAIVPDGPRGPREQARPGVVALAALTGAPIVPVAFAARPAWRLATWDRLLVPAPFAKAAAVFGPPLTVTRGDDRERAVKEIDRALGEATAAADRMVRP
jgi:lysophospholipid acyltransferase (LPLAT)-like uncharacterized protein